MGREEVLHTCCFTGHRPGKLDVPEAEVRAWLGEQARFALRDGYTTFITGCAMGVDIWAGEAVLELKAQNPAVRLVAAVPWPGMADRWDREWRDRYRELLRRADEVVTVSGHYHRYVYLMRNTWMVDRSSRLIAWYNGLRGGTGNTVRYAEMRGLEVVRWEMPDPLEGVRRGGDWAPEAQNNG